MMGGDERTRFPPGQEPIVRRRPGDLRDQVQVAPPLPSTARKPWSREATEPPQPPSGAPPRPETYSAGAPRDRLVEDGRFGELFVLFIINVLLGIITLGIYRFWGKTRIRKYIWSRSSFRGERFEYSGTGKELFVGFLIAFLFFGPPFIGFYLWLYFDPPRQGDDAGKLVGLVLGVVAILVLTFYFIHVATFAAYRYRVSRTIWRGIRGSVSGSAWTYGFLGFGLGWLNGLSLYWTKPWADSVLINYRLSRTTIGSEPLASKLDAGPLYGPFALAWVLTAVTLVAIGAVSAAFEIAGNKSIGALVIVLLLAYFVLPAVFLITINFYRAALLRRTAAASQLGGLSFRFEAGGWAVLWFSVSNFLIVLLSVGLLLPLAILRYARFIARYLRIEGEVDYAKLRQTSDRGPRFGEGIAEFFGVGIV